MQRSIFTPNLQTVSAAIFIIGLVTTFFLVIAALLALAWFLNFAMSVVCQIAVNMSHLYSSSNSITQLLFICVFGYSLYHVARIIYRKHRGA